MSNIISLLHFIVTNAVTIVANFVDLIVEDPLLIFFVLLSFCGLGLGLIRRIIS